MQRGALVGLECGGVTEKFWVKLSHVYLKLRIGCFMKINSNRKSINHINELERTNWDGVRPLIVFDGVCVLCSHFVMWVLKRDRKDVFLFTTAQSQLGQMLYRQFGLDGQNFETNLVIYEGEVYMRMAAFVKICSVLGLPWRLVRVIEILPNRLQDWLYEMVKSNRYRLFGKRQVCLVPDAALKARFVE